MKTFTATIQGLSSLIQHRFSESAEARSSTRAAVVEERIPRDEAEKCSYRMKDGTCYHPGASIARLLREAGGNHKLVGTRKSAKYSVPAAVIVNEEILVLTNGDGKTPIKDFEVDSRPVVIPATKGRVMRHRPRHDCWSTKFTLEINEKILPTDFVHKLLVEGGQQLGLGDFRPEKGGPFGRFSVVSWKELPKK